MAYGRKLLLTNDLTSNATPSQLPAAPPEAVTLEANFVAVLAALLCAIVCVIGLIVVARCAWLRRRAGGWSLSYFVTGNNTNQLANKGVKKKVLNALPKYTHKSDGSGAAGKEEAAVVVVEEDCAICLAEYVDGDEIRVLPQCGHRFHVLCIDTWLGSHSSCPSCRQILVPARCQKCGECPVVCSDRNSGGGDGGGSGKLRPNSSGASTPSPIILT